MPAAVPFDERDLERLVEAARLAGFGRLVPSFAHQLSTPLAAIALRSESLERAVETLGESEGLARVRRHLKAIHEEAFRCKELLSILQAFTRPAGTGDERVDLSGLCGQVSTFFHHDAMRRQVEIVTRLAETLRPVPGDEPRLAQAVIALMANAVLASPEGGVVTLETLAAGDRAVVAVTDQGPGVAASVEGRLFEPLVSSRAPGEGVGLGLMACQWIAAAHGGTLSWEPGQKGGARFVLSLPARPSADGEGTGQ